MINSDVGMGESMKETPLNKDNLFRDYISRYEYKDINKALDDFDEIFEILTSISHALQINSFNGHPYNMMCTGGKRDLEAEVTSIFSILCERGVIDSYPFKSRDRYVAFVPQLKGD